MVRDNLADLVAGMNALGRRRPARSTSLQTQIEARDREIDNPYGKDAQVMNIHNARKYIGDRLIRAAKPHRILDPGARSADRGAAQHPDPQDPGRFRDRPRLRACSAADGQIMPGLYAVGEAAGFGGGGMHGYRSLEGTFLGGCLFSGRNAGRAAAKGGWAKRG